MEVDYLLGKSILNQLCRCVYKTNTFREVAMVFGFSWLAEKVMNGIEKGIR